MRRLPALIVSVVLSLYACAPCARADTVVDFSLTGTASFESGTGLNNGSFTILFSVDTTTNSLAGPWSVSTNLGPLGSFSSSDAGEIGSFGSTLEGMTPVNQLVLLSPSIGEAVFNFPQTSPFTGGTAIDGSLQICANNGGFPGFCFAFGNYSALATAMQVTTTPEPNTVALLGSGLIGLVWLASRKLRASV